MYVKIIALFTASLLLLSLVFCGDPGEDPPGEDLPPVPRLDDSGFSVRGIQTLADANNRFSLAFYSNLKNDEEGNIFFSPYSISTALMMTYEGARGSTAEEMRTVFHFPEDEKIRRANSAAVHNQLNPQNAKYTLSAANALWPQENFTLEDDYVMSIRGYYGGEVTNLDFITRTEESRVLINDWVSDRTNEKINDLLPEGSLTALTRVVLTNAIYFKGIWKDQFKRQNTREEDFTLSGGRVVQAPMMTRTSENVSYAETQELQMLEMGYEGDDVSMLVLLPKTNLSSLEGSLTIENLNRWRALLSEQKVRIYFPRFTFRTKYSLVERLRAMGMPTAFDARVADFSGISRIQGLFISGIFHQAFVDVNEEGTEAAAATGVVVSRESAPPIFRADRPFIFIIQKLEKTTRNGHILFMGRVSDPRN